MIRGLAVIGALLLGYFIGYHFGFSHGSESAVRQPAIGQQF